MQKIDTGYPLDSDPDRAMKAGIEDRTGVSLDGDNAQQAAGDNKTLGPEDGGKPTNERLLQIAKAAEQQSVTFAQQNWRPQWEQAYKSFRSEYQDKSKYKSSDYRHRSKIFRPKTRISVTKDLAATAQLLFSTNDAVSITAGDETDAKQVANAELNAALVNYRLDRSSRNNAIPWFLVAMGARQDCQIAGICCSKQYWRYQEKEQTVDEPVIDPMTGQPALDPMGQPVTQPVTKMVPVIDKPEIDLFAVENVGLDPAASWLDPVNSAAFFFARHPMHVQDVMDRMKDPRIPWTALPAESDIWAKAKVKEYDLAGVRRAREGGTDRLDNQTANDRSLDVVWVVEWFIRTADEDWTFWTLGTTHLLSEPVTTREAYPWKNGDRPYRIGYGNLEAHRIVPQSPVETLRPLQQEINDITNLGLDNLKNVIQPVAKVKRGAKVDTDAVKRRYPVLYVSDMEDVDWDRPPSNSAAAFPESTRLDTDFDDLAGTFNGGSVASNRQVGETVGGMKMMAGAANAVSEFYQHLFVETWVEAVLSDISKLEAYYESDAKILALAQKRAPSMLKAGIGEITDDLLQQEVVVRVRAGVGSPDPMQKLAKIAQGVEVLTKVLMVSQKMKTGELQINEESWINEILGNVGIRDAYDRLFTEGPPMPQPGEEPPDGLSPEMELQDREKQRTHDMDKEKLKSKTSITGALIKAKADDRYQGRENEHDGKQMFIDTMMDALIEHQGLQERALDREANAKAMAQRPAPSAAL